jgi:hypothetical protein
MISGVYRSFTDSGSLEAALWRRVLDGGEGAMIQLALIATIYVAALVAIFTSLQEGVAWMHLLIWPEPAADSAALLQELREIETSVAPPEEPASHGSTAPQEE